MTDAARYTITGAIEVTNGLIQFQRFGDRGAFIPLGQVSWWEERYSSREVALFLKSRDVIILSFPSPLDSEADAFHVFTCRLLALLRDDKDDR